MIALLLVTASAYFTATLCSETHIVNVEADFNKIRTDKNLTEYVSEILKRLKTFKVPVHPRIRLFFQLLKKGMSSYADRTADTIYVPLKYNIL